MIRILLALSLAAAAPAAGQDATSVRVNYADLDLSRPEARAMLSQRVEIAVKAACGFSEMGETLAAEAAYACRVEARDSVRAQVRRALARLSASDRLAAR